jgi:tetratricopeptide (TPR) repeat protein
MMAEVRCRTAVILLVAAARLAFAQDRLPDPDEEIARRRFEQGTALYAEGRYADAAVEFTRGGEVKPSPAFDYNIARCFDRLERWDEAIAAYEKYIGAASPGADIAEARQRIEILRARRDAHRLPPGAAPAVEKRETARPRFGLAAPVVVGVAALALVATGLGLYFSAGSAFDGLSSSCAPHCDRAQWTGLQAEERAGVGLLAIGGALALVDVVLWTVRRPRPAHALWLAPGRASIAVGARF